MAPPRPHTLLAPPAAPSPPQLHKGIGALFNPTLTPEAQKAQRGIAAKKAATVRAGAAPVGGPAAPPPTRSRPHSRPLPAPCPLFSSCSRS